MTPERTLAIVCVVVVVALIHITIPKPLSTCCEGLTIMYYCSEDSERVRGSVREVSIWLEIGKRGSSVSMIIIVIGMVIGQ